MRFLWISLSLLITFSLPTSAAQTRTIQTLSATVRNQTINNATVILQRNGHPSVQATTDNQGKAKLNTNFADDLDTMLIIKHPNYSDLIVKCPCEGMTYALSPPMQNRDGIRMVLNWGASPNDLDSHIAFPDNHVYFGKNTGDNAELDVDDITKYGPETITLLRKYPGKRYYYGVHNFSNRDDKNSKKLSESGAKVFVYKGTQLIRTYYVPKNKKGNFWAVFAINGDGTFSDINQMKGIESEDRLNDSEFRKLVGAIGNSDTAQPENNSTNNDAKETFDRAEAAQKAGDLESAIGLYRNAVRLAPNNARYYLKLGAAQRESGSYDKAIWSCRKATELAGTDTATKASAYYNLGKSYEGQNKFTEALREYRRAKTTKENELYNKAIWAMKAKGAK